MLRWAVLGTGLISGTVVNAIAESDGSRVEVVAGRNPQRLADFQAQHRIERGVTDYRDAVTDPNVDAVYIGLETADALVDGVKARGTFFVEGLMYLAHPLYQRVVELVTDGRLGPIRSITGRYAADIWQVVNPKGKGTIYNLGYYPVSLLHLVIQSACGADAFANRTLTGTGSEWRSGASMRGSAKPSVRPPGSRTHGKSWPC